MIKEKYEEYVVEFSVTVADPSYSELLSDPEAPEYRDVARELTDKVRNQVGGATPQRSRLRKTEKNNL